MALAVLAAFAVGAFAYSRNLGSRAAVGKPAPDFTLQDMQGETFRLSALRGQVVFLNFWTSWCDPCRDETPELEAFHRRYGDQVVLIGVNVKEPVRAAQGFLEEFGVTYRVVRDTDGRVAHRYLVRGYPESWLIGKDGTALARWVGPVSFEELRQAVITQAGLALDHEAGPLSRLRQRGSGPASLLAAAGAAAEAGGWSLR